MGIVAAKTDKTFLLTRRSDPEQTAEQNIAGSRTHQIGAGCAMLCNPAQSLLLKTGKDTVFGSILVATNWFHENCGLLSDHFAGVVIDSAMPQSRMFLSAAEAFFSNLDAIDPSES